MNFQLNNLTNNIDMEQVVLQLVHRQLSHLITDLNVLEMASNYEEY